MPIISTNRLGHGLFSSREIEPGPEEIILIGLHVLKYCMKKIGP